ncbi:MAG: MATE family efflux transporter [Vicinamibacteraceae bacterium]
MASPPQAPTSRQRFDRRIIEGPLTAAVWHLAWPAMLQNAIGGAQGIVDHAMVGQVVGFTGNAAIGVSWQIFLIVIVFISSLYTGMGVLVSRHAGAGDAETVNRVVYQAFLTSIFLSLGVLAPIGYVAAPWLLDLAKAAPEVQAVALPYLRLMFAGSLGMLLFFMLGGALRAAGDSRTPLYLGVGLTLTHVALNVALITGAGPFPPLGVLGAAVGAVTSSIGAGLVGLGLLFAKRTPIWFSRGMPLAPDWTIIRSLFRFGLPTGLQGVAMNVGGLLLLRFIGGLEHSAEAQAAYAVGYNQLFSLITWTSVGLMGAAATVAGQNLGAGKPERAVEGVWATARIGLLLAGTMGLVFLLIPRMLLALFGMKDGLVLDMGTQLLRVLAVSGLFVTLALVHTGGLQGTGDTRSPFYISLISQVVVPLGLCFALQMSGALGPLGIWTAILLGHSTRAVLSIARFRQGKWRSIKVGVAAAGAR